VKVLGFHPSKQEVIDDALGSGDVRDKKIDAAQHCAFPL